MPSGGPKVAPAYITVFGAAGVGYHYLTGQVDEMLQQTAIDRAAQSRRDAELALQKQMEEAAAGEGRKPPPPNATIRAATQEEEDKIDRKWYEIVRKHE